MSPPRFLGPLAVALTVLAVLSPTPRALATDPTLVGGRGQPVLLVLGPEADEGLYRGVRGPRRSRGGLAEYLVRRGFQVWIASHTDLAQAIDHVRDQAGAESVSLVGHGLGGTACYRLLVAEGGGHVDRLVTVGAPYRWEPASPLLHEVIDALADPGTARYSQLAGRESSTTGSDLFQVALTSLSGDDADALLVAAREAGAVARHAALDDLPAWVAGASPLPRRPGQALLLCGEIDRIAPCEEAWRARDALGPAAEVHKFGYMNLDRLEFGHLDLVLSPDARRRVFPIVARYLRSGRSP